MSLRTWTQLEESEVGSDREEKIHNQKAKDVAALMATGSPAHGCGTSLERAWAARAAVLAGAGGRVGAAEGAVVLI